MRDGRGLLVDGTGGISVKGWPERVVRPNQDETTVDTVGRFLAVSN